MRVIMSGGAPLSPATHNFLRAVLGVDLLQVEDNGNYKETHIVWCQL